MAKADCILENVEHIRAGHILISDIHMVAAKSVLLVDTATANCKVKEHIEV